MRRDISLIALVALVLCYSCGAGKNTACSDFKTGRFQTHSEFDNSTSVIERNDSLQTETNLATGQIIRAHVRWTSDCEYELIYIEHSSGSVVEYLKTHALKNVILQSTRDYYIAKSTMDGLDMALIDTVRATR